MTEKWQKKLGQWQSWLLIVFMFFLPISSAAPNIILLLILILWLLEADFSRKWQQIKAHLLFTPMLAFALLYPVSLLWTDDMAWGVHMVERHIIYLLFPLLLTVVRREHIVYYLSAFVLAMTISETASYLVWFELIDITGIDPLDPAGFMGHWEYNPFLALAIYWMGHGLLFGQPKKWQILVFGVFIITMSINMFITGGRIGQIAYFALLLLLFGQYFVSKRILWRGLMSAMVGLMSIFVLAYSASDLFQMRVDRAIHEIQTHDNTKTGSVNTRFIMWQNTIAMLPHYLVLGTGIGDFPQDYNRFVGEDAPIKMSTFGQDAGHNQPHDQYLFELANFGILGFLVFVWLFSSLARVALKHQGNWWRLRQAFFLLTLVIMLTDSYLLVQAFSYLFVAMVAMLWTNDQKQVY